MMATDLSLVLRRQVVAHLKGNTPLIGLVSASNIYGERPDVAEPDWPFVRMGLPEVEGYEATCLDGSASLYTIHAFSKGTGGKYTDDISRIAAAIVEAMKSFAPTQYLVECEWRRTVILPEQDEGKFHAVVQFAITIAERT